MNKNEVLALVRATKRELGAVLFKEELDAYGWRGIKGNPIAFFSAYLADDVPEKNNLVKSDMNDILWSHFMEYTNGKVIQLPIAY